MEVELLYFEGCPNWKGMSAQLDKLAAELDFTWHPVLIETWEDAQAYQFHGSPSLHIDGMDPFAEPGAPIGLTCRIYASPDGQSGMPELDAMREVLRTASRD